MSYAPGREQIPVVTTSLEAIMSRPAFAVGVDDYRAGQPMRDLGAEMGTDLPIDEYREMVNAQWDYERGRHWAAIAPEKHASQDPRKAKPCGCGDRAAAIRRFYLMETECRMGLCAFWRPTPPRS